MSWSESVQLGSTLILVLLWVMGGSIKSGKGYSSPSSCLNDSRLETGYDGPFL